MKPSRVHFPYVCRTFRAQTWQALSEQRAGFLEMVEDQLAVPFTTGILAAPVRVERVRLNDTEAIVARRRRERQRQMIPPQSPAALTTPRQRGVGGNRGP